MSRFGPKPMLASDVFKRVIERSNGCWEYVGPLNKDGYGRFRTRGINLAHRAAYCAEEGIDPGDIAGMVVMHSCDNRKCCNPDHLSIGTVQDNASDCLTKGRTAAGEKNGQARLSEDHVRDILSRSLTSSEYAAKYGITDDSVTRIWRGERWSKLTKSLTTLP